jgi:hypothetical protein
MDTSLLRNIYKSTTQIWRSHHAILFTDARLELPILCPKEANVPEYGQLHIFIVMQQQQNGLKPNENKDVWPK